MTTGHTPTCPCGWTGKPQPAQWKADANLRQHQSRVSCPVTPPGGIVLEPFAGSGTTVEACIVEGFHCIAIEREADYLPLIMQRVNRRRDPVAYIKAAGDDLGLFDLEGLA